MNSRSLSLIAVAVVGVLVIGGGILLLGRSSHREALQTSFQKLRQAGSYHLTADLAIQLPEELKNRQRPLQAVTINVAGDVSQQEAIPQFAGTIRAEAKGPGMVLFTDGELRSFADTVAFRLENLPSLVNPSGNLQKKWTYVETPVFVTNNPEAIFETLGVAIENFTYEGKDTIPGTNDSGRHYTGSITPENEVALAQTLAKASSGNATLDVLARLLTAYDIQSGEMWVSDDTLRAIKVTFGKPGQETPSTSAQIQLTFSDFDKAVSLERPPKELTVRPDVFSQLFQANPSVSLKSEGQ